MQNNWTEQHAKILKNKKEELEQLPKFEYPFDEKLKDYLNSLETDTIPIFSYGSLLNHESAKRSVSEQTLNTMEPAVGFGLQRVFNRDIDISESDRYDQDHPKERGMLNVEYTGSFQDLINGVIINITQDEIEDICIREDGYDLVPIFNMHWDTFSDPKIENYKETHTSISYTFYAPDEERQGSIPVDESIFPIKQYYKLVKNGAKKYGQDFLDLWVDTTFLADKETNVKQWEKELN